MKKCESYPTVLKMWLFVNMFAKNQYRYLSKEESLKGDRSSKQKRQLLCKSINKPFWYPEDVRFRVLNNSESQIVEFIHVSEGLLETESSSEFDADLDCSGSVDVTFTLVPIDVLPVLPQVGLSSKKLTVTLLNNYYFA